ncbi:hypothetical protein LCL99_19715 [Halomonas denitrificans]|uniref:PssD/Cps14F family polysaccharide biosynthesis glycosyltransferase n=1 Tax=Halomonas denitrificans TaxID=370769 RepID=UPI001CD66544|nr:PssD/Cps14F family polysaccharide biosynthesis glycosyltransferase [Halomonas denitrificans]MCA0976701.1 hypothetical protein [Halomonas denitrificans]
MKTDSKSKVVAFAYGCGGHKAQAFRLYEILAKDLRGLTIITISDDSDTPPWSSKHYVVSEARSKSSFKAMFFLQSIYANLVNADRVRRAYDIRTVVSTGPGLSFLFAVYYKLFGKAKVIHIETWSRFYSASITGKMMYYISDAFYYQNEELAHLYPKGKYSGRL